MNKSDLVRINTEKYYFKGIRKGNFGFILEIIDDNKCIVKIDIHKSKTSINLSCTLEDIDLIIPDKNEYFLSMKLQCPCCLNYSFKLEVDDYHDEGFCPVCLWKNDFFYTINPILNDEPEYISLTQARMNYQEFEASSEKLKDFVRKPLISELPENNSDLFYDKVFVEIATDEFVQLGVEEGDQGFVVQNPYYTLCVVDIKKKNFPTTRVWVRRKNLIEIYPQYFYFKPNETKYDELYYLLDDVDYEKVDFLNKQLELFLDTDNKVNKDQSRIFWNNWFKDVSNLNLIHIRDCIDPLIANYRNYLIKGEKKIDKDSITILQTRYRFINVPGIDNLVKHFGPVFDKKEKQFIFSFFAFLVIVSSTLLTSFQNNNHTGNLTNEQITSFANIAQNYNSTSSVTPSTDYTPQHTQSLQDDDPTTIFFTESSTKVLNARSYMKQIDTTENINGYITSFKMQANASNISYFYRPNDILIIKYNTQSTYEQTNAYFNSIATPLESVDGYTYLYQTYAYPNEEEIAQYGNFYYAVNVTVHTNTVDPSIVDYITIIYSYKAVE